MSILLRHILKAFDKEFHNNRIEFEEELQEHKEKLLAQFNSFKNENTICKHRLLKLSPKILHQTHIIYNKDPGFQSNDRCQNT